MKAVILAAGLGSRLIPYSKEMPKEMLPILVVENGKPVLKPILQAVFEQLYEAGVREFCFVVGRGKRTVEDHFTPDWDYVEFLRGKGKLVEAVLLERFYRRIEDSSIVWVNQPLPRGTGDAVMQARRFAGNGYFFVAAGDNIFLGDNVAQKLLELHRKLDSAVIAAKRLPDARKYGVLVGHNLSERVLKLEAIIEKPEKPPTNLVNTSLYLLPPDIFDTLGECELSPRGELEITDAIQKLIQRGIDIYAYDVGDTHWVDVGTPETYLEALLLSLKVSGDLKVARRAAEVLGL